MACTFHAIYIEVRSMFSKLLGKTAVDAIEEGKAPPPESRRATPEEIFGTVYMEVVSTPEERRRKRRQRGAKRVRQVAISRIQKRGVIIAQRDLYRRHRFAVQAKLNQARANVASNSFGTQTDLFPETPIVPTVSVEVQTITETRTKVIEISTQTEQVKEICTQTDEVKEICTQTEEAKEICTQTEEVKEICTQTEEVKEICTQTEEVKESCTQTNEVKEICTQTNEVKEICTQTNEVKEICTQTEVVKEIFTQTEEVKEIYTQIEQLKEISTQVVEANKKIAAEPAQSIDCDKAIGDITVEAAEAGNVDYPGCAAAYAEARPAKVYIAAEAVKAVDVIIGEDNTITEVNAIPKADVAAASNVNDIKMDEGNIDPTVSPGDKILQNVLGDMVGNVSGDVLDDLLSEVLEEEMVQAGGTQIPINPYIAATKGEDMAVPLQGVVHDLIGEVANEVVEELVFEVLEEEMLESEDGNISSDEEGAVMEDTPRNADRSSNIEEPMEASQSDISDADLSYDEDVEAVVKNMMGHILDAVVEDVNAFNMAAEYDMTDSEDEDEQEFAKSGAYLPVNGLRSSFSTIMEDEELALELDGESGYASNQSLNSRSACTQSNGSMKIILGDMSDDEGDDAGLKIAISDLNTEVSDLAINKATRNEVIPELFFSLRNGALNIIGRGSYGNVYKAYYNGDDVAVKVSALKQMCDMPESQILNKLEYHPCIIEMLANYSVLNKFEGIVMEAAKGTTTALVSQIRDTMLNEPVQTVFDPFYTVYFTSAISQAITYLHHTGIVHLDINPGNILLMASGIPKISDFGSAVIWDPEQGDLNSYPIGTEGFQAPEVIMESGYNSTADWFGFGAVLCYVNMGRLPWGTCQMAQMEMLERGTLEKHLVDSELFHQHLLGLVLTLLQVNPEHRMTYGTQELLAAFDCHEVCQNIMMPPDTPTLEFIQNQFTC